MGLPIRFGGGLGGLRFREDLIGAAMADGKAPGIGAGTWTREVQGKR